MRSECSGLARDRGYTVDHRNFRTHANSRSKMPVEWSRATTRARAVRTTLHVRVVGVESASTCAPAQRTAKSDFQDADALLGIAEQDSASAIMLRYDLIGK